MHFEIHRTIPADHPALPGHFPGQPIVPGVVILDEVASALAQWNEHARLTGIGAVKFLSPLKPNQSFTVLLSAPETWADEIAFSCTRDGQVITEGRLQVVIH